MGEIFMVGLILIILGLAGLLVEYVEKVDNRLTRIINKSLEDEDFDSQDPEYKES